MAVQMAEKMAQMRAAQTAGSWAHSMVPRTAQTKACSTDYQRETLMGWQRGLPRAAKTAVQRAASMAATTALKTAQTTAVSWVDWMVGSRAGLRDKRLAQSKEKRTGMTRAASWVGSRAGWMDWS